MIKNNFITSGLFTDFYELTMAQGYWKKKINDNVVFDVFFRKNPFNGGFSVLAGTEPLFDAIQDFRFSKEDLDFLRQQKIFEEDFLRYLQDFKFTGEIYAMEEGSIVFPQEPVLRIHGNLIETQIIEGLVLNTINFQSLVATKTARIWLTSHKSEIMEFGLRRAQGSDGAMSATRAAFIGGAAGTSNTLAGKLYGIPVMGTMAHSWVMAHDSELEAFREFAKLYPENSIFLIDTYDTLKSGIKNAIIAGGELVKQGYNFGVRLDSGDLAYLTKAVRKELDKAGFPQAKICISNELSEEIISALRSSNSPIDSYGVGTQMVTGGSESGFSGVYKLSAKKSESEKEYIPSMKISDNPEKTSNPGIKNVYRLYDQQNNACADIICLENEKIESGKEYQFHHPIVDYIKFNFTPVQAQELLTIKMSKGKKVEQNISENEKLLRARKLMEKQLDSFDESYKRILNPHVYKVSLTTGLKKMKMDFINKSISD